MVSLRNNAAETWTRKEEKVKSLLIVGISYTGFCSLVSWNVITGGID